MAAIKDLAALYHWIRNPIWITAGFAQTWAGHDGANFAYTEEQKKFLKENPKKYLEYRKQVSGLRRCVMAALTLHSGSKTN